MAFANKLDWSSILNLKQNAKNTEAEFFDIDTAKEWFSLIEDGVPEDVALKRLEEEANGPEAPEVYKESCREISYEEVFKNLTKVEYKVISMYCTESEQFYLRLNEDCRNRNWKKYVVYTSLLHSVCMKLRNMPMAERNRDNHLYRGLRCGVFKGPAAEFCWPCFTSATPERRIAVGFGDTVITLQSKTGAPVRRFSDFFEYEVLFSPFLVFKTERKQSSAIYRSLSEKSDFFLSFPFFRGAMLGAAVSNCIGSPFEFDDHSTMESLLKFLNEQEESGMKTTLNYNCDTSMTFALAKSLIEKNGLNIRNLKDSLADEYTNDPERNYGQTVITVLEELSEQEPHDDPFAPAQSQFDGSGSHGNGGAMRVSPAALFFYKYPRNQFKDKVSQITRLTHAHINGINGAILLAFAVRSALFFALEGAWDNDIRKPFVRYLLKLMTEVEGSGGLVQSVFSQKLRKIQRFIGKAPTLQKVRSNLGTGMSADESVPAAIYCFIRGLDPIETIPPKYNAFERTIIYAISLGGDTDTIASMAGAIAGAYYGQDAVTQRWRDLCETKAIDDAKLYAKQIHSLVWK